MLNNKMSKMQQYALIITLGLLLAVVVMLVAGTMCDVSDEMLSERVSLANGELSPPNTTQDPEETYETMRSEFYKILNRYVVPTTVALGVAVLTISLVTLGLNRAKEQDEAKIQAINKRMIQWAIGAVMVFLAPIIVMAIAEIAIGILNNWGV